MIVGRDLDVRRLEIAVNEPLMMGVVQGDGNLGEQSGGAGEFERAAVGHDTI